MEDQRESPRFLWVAALTVVVSVIAVLAVRAAAVHILHPSPAFMPLAVGPPIVDTILCVIVAIFVFLKASSHGVTVWRYLSTLVLLLSFIPDVLLAKSHGMGGGWPEACALMTMHVVVWAVCVTLLPALAFTTPSPTGDRGDDRLSIL